MRDLQNYEVNDFHRYSEWYLGKNMRPAAINAIIRFAMEHPEEKDIRSDIFATMVRCSTDIQNEFLGMAMKSSGVTNGHDCFCRFVRPIRANMFYIQIDADEYISGSKCVMTEMELPEAFHIKRLITNYGIALQRLEDIDFEDSYGAMLQHMSGLETEKSRVLGELEMRKVYLRDKQHQLGVNIMAQIRSNDWRARIPVKVCFTMIPEKLGNLVQLIPRDEQKRIIERRDEMIDEFCDAYLRYRE